MPDERPTLDLSALVQGFVDDLRVTARSDPGGDGEPADTGRGRFREAVRQVRDEQEEAAGDVNERYRARAAAMQDVLAERQRRLEAYGRRRRQAVPTDPDLFVVAGRIRDRRSGVGLPGVRVRATDLDRRQDDVLGEVRTDALGYYRLDYRAADIDERDENPETYIEVLDEAGEVLATSTRSFVQKAGRSAFISAAVDGQRVPTSLRMAGKVDGALTTRQEDFARRRRSLDVTADVRLRATLPTRRRVGPAAAGRGPDGRPLTEVRGIGPAFRKRLEREGVTSAAEVAGMEPARLAEVLSVGEGRARRIVEAAKEAGREG